VRLPLLTDLTCAASTRLPCQLSGANLFFLDSISGDPGFKHAVQVPDGYPGYALAIPHPTDGVLYVKLRDDPSVISRATVASPEPPPDPDEVAPVAVTVMHEAMPSRQ
jgi:hypothetical protein